MLHDPLAEDALLQRARRLRARSEVFIGAVNSRNPVTLSPSHEHYLRLRSCSLSETRAPITPIRFCIVIPKDSAISCSSPQLFPRRSSFSSASPPRSFFSYFPLIFVRSKKIFSKFSPEFFFPILLLLGSFAKEVRGELRQLEETRSIDFASFVRPFSILLSTCVTASILPSDWPFFTPPLRASRPYSPSFQLHPPRQLLTRLTPNVQAFYSGNSCRSKTSTTESRFMGTTLPPDTPQREYIDRWKGAGKSRVFRLRDRANRL